MTVKELERLYDDGSWSSPSQIEFKNSRGEILSRAVSDLLPHAANHVVHHRGQIALLVRLGRLPGDFDMLLFDADRRGGEP